MELLDTKKYFEVEDIPFLTIDDVSSLIWKGGIYPLELVNRWVISCDPEQCRTKYYCIKMVDSDTFYKIYHDLFITIKVLILNDTVNIGLYEGPDILIDINTQEDMIDIVTKCIQYIDSKDVMSSKELIAFGLSLGGRYYQEEDE